MKITAHLVNGQTGNAVHVKTGERQQTITIATKPDGFGLSVNGGELLLLALATCYCNDIYREARKRGMVIDGVEVEVTGKFGGEGEAGHNISYRATVTSPEPEDRVLELMRHTDSVAEIHNTLRQSTPVSIADCVVRAR